MTTEEIQQYQKVCGLMKEFLHSEYWDVYGKRLARMIEGSKDRVVSGTKEEFEYYKGIINGLAMAYNLPRQMIEEASYAEKGK